MLSSDAHGLSKRRPPDTRQSTAYQAFLFGYFTEISTACIFLARLSRDTTSSYNSFSQFQW